MRWYWGRAQHGGFLLRSLLLSLPSAAKGLDSLDPQAMQEPQIRNAQGSLLGLPEALAFGTRSDIRTVCWIKPSLRFRDSFLRRPV